jgi:hypothetical protein
MEIEIQQPVRSQNSAMFGEIAETTVSYQLEELYEYRNCDEVTHYLQAYPKLINFLQESYDRLLKLFGTTAKFALEVVRDPEAQYKQLMVYINTSLPVDAALNRLDRLDHEWFLDHVKSLGHLINFNLELA